MNELEEKEIAVKYFLGMLTDETLESVEERLFSDNEYADLLDEVEADLIDEYVRGELSEAEKLRFESNYLVSDSRRDRARAAFVLLEMQAHESERHSKVVDDATHDSIWTRLGMLFHLPGLAYAFSALLVLVFGGAIWLGWPKKNIEIVRTTPTPTPTPVPTITTQVLPTADKNANVEDNKNTDETPFAPKSSPGRLPQPVPRGERENQLEPSAPLVATFFLAGGGLRGNDDVQRLVIAKGVTTVRLTIEDLEIEKFAELVCQLENDQNGPTTTRTIKNTRKGKRIILSLPVNGLRNAIYKLTVRGRTDANEDAPINIYRFRVEKK